MRIGIIGAGLVGRAVAKLGVAAGHQVMVSNSRGLRSLGDVPRGVGCEIGAAEKAAPFGDVVAVVVPSGHCRAAPVELNAITAADSAKVGLTAGSLGRRALPIASDDAAAKVTVADLVDQSGYDALDAGSLTESRRFERGKPSCCFSLDRAGLMHAPASAQRDVGPADGAWQS